MTDGWVEALTLLYFLMDSVNFFPPVCSLRAYGYTREMSKHSGKDTVGSKVWPPASRHGPLPSEQRLYVVIAEQSEHLRVIHGSRA